MNDVYTIKELADFFDLPPTFVARKAEKFFEHPVALDAQMSRFDAEAVLLRGDFKGTKWAAASLGLTVEFFNQCVEHEALSEQPIMAGHLPLKDHRVPSDDRKIYCLSSLKEWVKIFTRHQGVTSLQPHGDMRAFEVVGLNPMPQICTVAQKYSMGNIRSSTLCAVTGNPIWESHGCELDNGKPLGLNPDLVSYAHLIENPPLRYRVKSYSYEKFLAYRAEKNLP